LKKQPKKIEYLKDLMKRSVCEQFLAVGKYKFDDNLELCNGVLNALASDPGNPMLQDCKRWNGMMRAVDEAFYKERIRENYRSNRVVCEASIYEESMLLNFVRQLSATLLANKTFFLTAISIFNHDPDIRKEMEGRLAVCRGIELEEMEKREQEKNECYRDNIGGY
jgi:hypothetical protein